jgi:hypothetical protein
MAITLDDGTGTLVILGEKNLGTGAHTHEFVREIVALTEDAAGLRDERGVDFREQRRIIEHIVFHDEHDGNAHLESVVLNVALVLDILNDGEQQARVPLPEKDLLNALQGAAREQGLRFLMVEGKDGNRNVQPGAVHGGGEFQAVHVIEVDVGDNEVVARLAACEFERLGGGGYVRDLRRVVEMEDEGIVEAGDEQNILHPERHEVLEAFKKAFVIGEELRRLAWGHVAKPYNTCEMTRAT